MMMIKVFYEIFSLSHTNAANKRRSKKWEIAKARCLSETTTTIRIIRIRTTAIYWKMKDDLIFFFYLYTSSSISPVCELFCPTESYSSTPALKNIFNNFLFIKENIFYYYLYFNLLCCSFRCHIVYQQIGSSFLRDLHTKRYVG